MIICDLKFELVGINVLSYKFLSNKKKLKNIKRQNHQNGYEFVYF